MRTGFRDDPRVLLPAPLLQNVPYSWFISANTELHQDRTLTLPASHRLCDDRHLNYVIYSEPSLLYQDSPIKQLSRLRGILPPGRGCDL